MDEGFIGPGMVGDRVIRVQRFIGAKETGVYDAETEQRVRGLQVLHQTTLRDGCWDDELEQKMFGVSG